LTSNTGNMEILEEEVGIALIYCELSLSSLSYGAIKTSSDNFVVYLAS